MLSSLTFLAPPSPAQVVLRIPDAHARAPPAEAQPRGSPLAPGGGESRAGLELFATAAADGAAKLWDLRGGAAACGASPAATGARRCGLARSAGHQEMCTDVRTNLCCMCMGLM